MKVQFKLTSSVTGKTVILTLKGDEESVQNLSEILLGNFHGPPPEHRAYEIVKVGAVRVPT